MTKNGAILIAILFVGLSGCGTGNSVSAGQAPRHLDAAAFAHVTVGKNGRLAIVPSDLPPPKTILVRDIKLGSGPVARRGDRVAVQYKGVNYQTGKLMVHAWPPSRPLVVSRLGFEHWGKSWEEGIAGMRVGGRRELVIPRRLTGQGADIDYVVELVRVQP